MARRNGQGSGPKKRSSLNDASHDEVSPPVGLPQEANSQILPSDQVAQAVGELDVSAVTVPTLHESEPDLATELLETVSASAIQLHPAEPTEPAPAEKLESHDAEVAQHSQALTPKLEDGSADLSSTHAEPIRAIEDPIGSAHGTSNPSDTKPENDTLISLQAAPATNLTLLEEANSGASDRGDPTPKPNNALVSPFGLLRTVIEANLSVWSYLRDEREAALAHLQALGSVKSPADLLGVQAREASRSLQAALDLGQDLARSSQRIAEGPGGASKDNQ